MSTHSFSPCADHCLTPTQTASRKSMTLLCVQVMSFAQRRKLCTALRR